MSYSINDISKQLKMIKPEKSGATVSTKQEAEGIDNFDDKQNVEIYEGLSLKDIEERIGTFNSSKIVEEFENALTIHKIYDSSIINVCPCCGLVVYYFPHLFYSVYNNLQDFFQKEKIESIHEKFVYCLNEIEFMFDKCYDSKFVEKGFILPKYIG